MAGRKAKQIKKANHRYVFNNDFTGKFSSWKPEVFVGISGVALNTVVLISSI